METINLKKYLKTLGFFPKDGESGTFSKTYKTHNNYEIFVDVKDSLNASRINWGDKIKVVRTTSSDLSKKETWVVLECIDRLLNIGYKPEKMILEKQWKLGHKGKGFLDIQVLDEEGNSFLLIECKTWGKEYDKEKNNTLKDGGQIFSYFIQEKQTKYIALYSSFEENNQISFKSDIIVINDQISSAQNQKEAFEAWNPQVFEKRGLFESSEIPYKVKFLGITKTDLKPLTSHDGGNIFNRFAEILRKNVVSDKTNAFNKIFNLFLCKIVDEDKRQDHEEMKFQWKQNEQNEDVLLRLNDLYKEGMKEYLNLDISAVSEKELEDSLKNVDSKEGKEIVKKLFIQQKLYSGNEFAFKEVFDKDSFEKNCVVVKEVVKLLEEYQIKYQHKQQFLGDFFEKLLNTGIKQEAGQFFTPIPLTAFICKSLPIEKIIDEKNDKGKIDFLPYVIDFASGSGHFLTEMMSEIENYVIKIDKTENWIKGGREAEKKFNAHKNDYYWAKEYIYGIEKDYRLAKTTKISTFLNGDGDANVICADGLDNFELSKDYKGKLRITIDGKNNNQFDVLIANPPYSVSGFKTTLSHGKKSFDLFPYLTDKSNEIECLFIERLKQLLTEKGVAGIILPTSILNSGKIHKKAREIILKNFLIKGIVEVGGNAFMEAGIKTVILFLKKRDATDADEIDKIANKFFKDLKDFSWKKDEQIVKKYIENTFGDSISFSAYVNFLNGKISDEIAETELGEWYIEKFNKKIDKEKIITEEKEKLFYFLLSYNEPVVIVQSGEKQEEKDFLGYEFSSRKGSEGIKIYETNKLFNPENVFDKTKVNSYILNNFLGRNPTEIDKDLKNNVVIKKFHKVVDFKNIEFDAKIITKDVEDIELNSIWPLRPLKSLLSELETGSRPKGGVARIKDGIPSIGGEHINPNGKVSFIKRKKFIPIEFYNQAKQGQINKGDILICKDGAQTGKVALVSDDFPYQDALANEHVYILRANKDVKQKYLFAFLLTDIGQKILRSKTTGSAQGGLNKPSLKSIKIPIPDEPTQKKILNEIAEIEKKGLNWKEDMLKEKRQEIVYQYLKPEIKIVMDK